MLDGLPAGRWRGHETIVRRRRTFERQVDLLPESLPERAVRWGQAFEPSPMACCTARLAETLPAMASNQAMPTPADRMCDGGREDGDREGLRNK